MAGEDPQLQARGSHLGAQSSAPPALQLLGEEQEGV